MNRATSDPRDHINIVVGRPTPKKSAADKAVEFLARFLGSIAFCLALAYLLKTGLRSYGVDQAAFWNTFTLVYAAYSFSGDLIYRARHTK
ncbi:hypothetical protein [Actinomadura yumaensis]|uniref:CASP-like protein n=1 Tax=Actinomadura yumaensis TaxID=111807 RepID=A0ABW2CNU4_9ACTN